VSKFKELHAGHKETIEAMANDPAIRSKAIALINETAAYKYSYNFTWLGRPIIQLPQDIVAVQEIIWTTRPDVIIETGVAHGGSLILSASIQELLGGAGQVVGIDVDIREHNRVEIEKHPLSKRITLIEGFSVDAHVIDQVKGIINGKQSVMVTLDSSHTHEHVLEELRLYSPMVTRGCYLVVLDTIVEDMTDDSFPDRPWSVGSNPKTAVWEFLRENDRFGIDKELENRLLLTAAPDGYLQCLKD
jgi:cephalosporin hydroxylase